MRVEGHQYLITGITGGIQNICVIKYHMLLIFDVRGALRGVRNIFVIICYHIFNVRGEPRGRVKIKKTSGGSSLLSAVAARILFVNSGDAYIYVYVMILYNTIQYYTVLYNSIQYYTLVSAA